MKKTIFILMCCLIVLPLSASSGGQGHGLSEGYWFKFIASVVNIVVFVGVLVYLLKKPIASALSTNQETVARQLKEAEEKQNESEQKLNEIEKRMAGLKDEIEEILKKTDEAANREKETIIERAHEEARKIEQMAQKTIERKFSAARAELSTYATELAVKKAEDIIRSKVTPEDIAASMEKYIEELEAKQ